jgi:predicted amidohydrolase YtcJ
MFPDQQLSDDIGRPVDQVAGGIDGRGRINPDTPASVLDQLLTPEQALRAITTEAAYAINDEANRGHLGPGTYGDITILSGDITAGTLQAIRSLSVVATIAGGESLFCAEPTFCP